MIFILYLSLRTYEDITYSGQGNYFPSEKQKEPCCEQHRSFLVSINLLYYKLVLPGLSIQFLYKILRRFTELNIRSC